MEKLAVLDSEDTVTKTGQEEKISSQVDENSSFEFYEEENRENEDLVSSELPPWKVLISDDVEGVHELTTVLLKYFKFEGAPLQFLNTYSGRETRQLIKDTPDIAVILLDVIMETDEEGLEIVKYIREELQNPIVQIVIRTGQAGRHPERDTILNNDINFYQAKSGLDSDRLITLIVSSLRAYKLARSLQDENLRLEQEIKEKKS